MSGTKNKHLFEEVLSRHKKWLRQFFAILPLSISFLHDVLDNCEITVFECIIDTSAGSTLLMLPELLVLAPGRAIDSSDPCKIPIGATAFQLGEMSSVINF